MESLEKHIKIDKNLELTQVATLTEQELAEYIKESNAQYVFVPSTER